MSEEKPKGGPTEQQIREAIAANLKVDLAPGDVGAAAEAVMALYARYVHWLETDCDFATRTRRSVLNVQR